MNFRFFEDDNNRFERRLMEQNPDGIIEGVDDDFPGLPDYEPLPQNAVVFVSVSHTRDSLSDEQFADICKEQRVQLIEKMKQQGQITQTIVSQDNIGFTLRTELINF